MDANITLEEKCKTCDGTGIYYKDRCPDCEGEGSVVTEVGAEILDFVLRRVRLGQRTS